MSSSRNLRLGLAALSCAAAVLLLALPAGADAIQDCIDQGNAQGIDAPTCVEQDGKLVPLETTNDPFGTDTGSGIPSGFIAFFVLFVLLGTGVSVWRVTAARKLARDAGMDPNVATGITLLDDNGLSATYLASSLRHSTPAPAAAPVSAPATARLTELKNLLDGGLITQPEYDERRKAIVNSL